MLTDTRWICLLLTLGLVILLAVISRFAINDIEHHARKDDCHNRQRQIILAMGVYSYDNNQSWPVFPCDSLGRFLPAAGPTLDPTATAIASLEFLTAITGGDLSIKTFTCNSRPDRHPVTPANPLLGTGYKTSAWAAAGPQHIGFAYDWSVPATARSNRVVVADRDRTAHKSIVFAAFADGHMGNINGGDGHFRNRDAADDDIYDDTGDGPMNVAGAGSTTRAFVR
jgi:hypothetical protein